MEVKPLFNIDIKPKLINRYETVLYNSIISGARLFYLTDFALRDKVKLRKARNELIKLGIIICVMDSEASIYSISTVKEIKNKLVNISFMDFKIGYQRKFPFESDKNKWIEEWIKNFNEWLFNYYPKIKNSIV